MQRSRLIRAAGVAAATVVVAAVVGAQPAHADITVDSAVCISNALGAMNPSVAAIVQQPDFTSYALVYWQTTTDTMYCHQANGRLVLVHNGQVSRPLGLGFGNARLYTPGLYTLRLATSVGGKDLASVQVIQP
jgi:hypothetical protein